MEAKILETKILEILMMDSEEMVNITYRTKKRLAKEIAALKLSKEMDLRSELIKFLSEITIKVESAGYALMLPANKDCIDMVDEYLSIHTPELCKDESDGKCDCKTWNGIDRNGYCRVCGGEPRSILTYKDDTPIQTAEEILNDYGCPAIPFDERITMSYPAIIKAMEHYASLHKKEVSDFHGRKNPKDVNPYDARDSKRRR